MTPPPGARLLSDGSADFVVWAPLPDSVALHLLDEDRTIPLARDPSGYWSVRAPSVRPGARYRYVLDGDRARADPASRLQPEGPSGPSAIVDSRFGWTDQDWHGLDLQQYTIYELHVGTFTTEGTFDAVIPRLDELRELGITAIELMPIAEFSGARNWGYDGVLPYAAQHTYGGADGLRRLVDACHARGLALVLDVVYNHLGPEHNYLSEFGPYFTDHYRTPWGSAINFDGPDSDAVRQYFIENALYWITDCHIDALRLDAIHAILDLSATHFLEELGTAVRQRAHQLDRKVHLIAESDLNAPRIVQPLEHGGYGMDAQWMDDFHHALHVLLTGERSGYYEGYTDAHDLARSYREGFVYAGQYASIRRRRHGRAAHDVPPCRFVVCAQNHDQIGNRMMGDRLAASLDGERLKLAAAAVVLSPFIPLLFMGEEYGDPAPFPYFVSHDEEGLVQAVREGRAQEFADFEWQSQPPDPQSMHTFESAMVNPQHRENPQNAALYALYGRLFGLRTALFGGAATQPGTVRADVVASDRTIAVVRPGLTCDAALLLNFRSDSTEVVLTTLGEDAGVWHVLLDTSDTEWAGTRSGLAGRDVRGTDRITIAPWSALLLRA